MIKFVLLGALFGVSTLLGYKTSKIYDNNYAFFCDLQLFVKGLKDEISFLKTDFLTLIEKFQCKSALGKILTDFKDLIKSNVEYAEKDIDDIIQKHIYIENDQRKIIVQMLFELGKIGYVEQLERFEYYTNIFESNAKESREKMQKMSPFCKKMGILIGLLVCIVLI